MNCRSADFIGYSIFLEMRFCDVSEVPEKPVFTRLFDLFATDMLANVPASITLRMKLRYGRLVLPAQAIVPASESHYQ
jgi:hypothetical protein